MSLPVSKAGVRLGSSGGHGGRLAQPPSATASRLPQAAGPEEAAPSTTTVQAEVPPNIQYADRSIPAELAETGLQRDAFTSTVGGSFHLSSDDPFEFTNERHPTGTNSPHFLESLRINTRIVSSATLSQLHVVVAEEVENMGRCALGTVNASSALYRATVLWKEFLDGCKGERCRPEKTSCAKEIRSRHLVPIVETLRPALLQLVRDSEFVKPYDIAISMWSLATLRMADDETFEGLSARLLTMLHRLNPTDMAHVMWACGYTTYRKSPLLLDEICTAAVECVWDFKPCELSTFVWGMCRTNHRSRPMLAAVADRMLAAPEEFATEELVRIVWAFTKCQFFAARDSGVHAIALRELTKPERLRTMLPQDYANLLWALAGLKVSVNPLVLNQLADCIVPHLQRYKNMELANVVYGFGSMMHRHDEFLLEVADEVVRRGQAMSNQELCMIIWSYGKLGVVPEDGELLTSVCGEFMRRMQQERLNPLTMSNMIKAFAKLEHMPEGAFMDTLSASAVASLDRFRMAELSNLLWAYQQLRWADQDLFERSEEFMIENMHLCTHHHISSVVNSLKRSGYTCNRLVTVARNNDFHV